MPMLKDGSFETELRKIERQKTQEKINAKRENTREECMRPMSTREAMLVQRTSSVVHALFIQRKSLCNIKRMFVSTLTAFSIGRKKIISSDNPGLPRKTKL